MEAEREALLRQRQAVRRQLEAVRRRSRAASTRAAAADDDLSAAALSCSSVAADVDHALDSLCDNGKELSHTLIKGGASRHPRPLPHVRRDLLLPLFRHPFELCPSSLPPLLSPLPHPGRDSPTGSDTLLCTLKMDSYVRADLAYGQALESLRPKDAQEVKGGAAELPGPPNGRDAMQKEILRLRNAFEVPVPPFPHLDSSSCSQASHGHGDDSLVLTAQLLEGFNHS